MELFSSYGVTPYFSQRDSSSDITLMIQSSYYHRSRITPLSASVITISSPGCMFCNVFCCFTDKFEYEVVSFFQFHY